MREQAVDVQDAADLLVTAGAPGAAARVDDGSEVRQAASGVADLRTGRSMQPDLHFRAGSITKSFVATLVLQLVSEGVCSLEDTAERWLPGLLPEGDGVTIRRLLNHTAGVPQYTDIVWHDGRRWRSQPFGTAARPGQLEVTVDGARWLVRHGRLVAAAAPAPQPR